MTRPWYRHTIKALVQSTICELLAMFLERWPPHHGHGGLFELGSRVLQGPVSSDTVGASEAIFFVPPSLPFPFSVESG